ncbi:DUF1064 domain-containing protein [Novosphingobium sp.]|uniref:DUF1064 domain-containing protein n=1 Tax=Novosphingobium sp. TaxID=1874826 RepID=UPI0028AD49D4|nr:DUF1064 domain-containing protein [Novosphingobium sp.]
MKGWTTKKRLGPAAGPFGKAGNKYGAKKCECRAGHVHDSKAEARRCNELQLMERAGAIIGLEQQPVFRFEVDGRPVMLDNGQQARLKADFSYIENGRKVVEDRKGVIVRDFPLRWALARTMWPDIEWRVV